MISAQNHDSRLCYEYWTYCTYWTYDNHDIRLCYEYQKCCIYWIYATYWAWFKNLTPWLIFMIRLACLQSSEHTPLYNSVQSKFITTLQKLIPLTLQKIISLLFIDQKKQPYTSNLIHIITQYKSQTFPWISTYHIPLEKLLLTSHLLITQ